MLLALPGLYGLSVLSSWAARRGAQKPSTNAQDLARVALVTYRASLLLLTLVAAWSLVDGRLVIATPGCSPQAPDWCSQPRSRGNCVPRRGRY